MLGQEIVAPRRWTAGVALVGSADHPHQDGVAVALGKGAPKLDGAHGAAAARPESRHAASAPSAQVSDLGEKRQVGVDRNVVLEVDTLALRERDAGQRNQKGQSV